MLQTQRATAIYWNHDNDLVIRQERNWYEEDDPFIVVTKSNVNAFLDRLCDVCGILSVGGPNR